MKERISVESGNGVAWIGLDDGKVNAMSIEMLADIAAALDRAEKEGAIVVLTGREGIFSAGFDLPTFSRGLDVTVEMMSAGAKLIQRLLSFPRPVVTVCTGHAYPMGAFLMLAADVRLCAEGSWRIGMNEVAIGLTVPKFAIELARHRLTPPGFARITTGIMFDPFEAMQMGYLDRVVPADQLNEALARELERLRALDMSHFVPTKIRINEQVLRAVETALDQEIAAVYGR